jgi:hypothetical protein
MVQQSTLEIINKVTTPPETTITTNFNDSIYHQALYDAYNDIRETKIQSDVLELEGMSGCYYRCFINNLIRNIQDARYLEVGSWKGSTACSAMSNNKATITCIDNWSEFGGPKQEFLENTSKYTNKDINFTFKEANCSTVDYTAIGKYNVYLYDGHHSEMSQYYGIIQAQPALDDVYIQIVDDYNWAEVRRGTERAIKDLNLQILEEINIRTTLNNAHTNIYQKISHWHNGYYIAVLKKS